MGRVVRRKRDALISTRIDPFLLINPFLDLTTRVTTESESKSNRFRSARNQINPIRISNVHQALATAKTTLSHNTQSDSHGDALPRITRAVDTI